MLLQVLKMIGNQLGALHATQETDAIAAMLRIGRITTVALAILAMSARMLDNFFLTR